MVFLVTHDSKQYWFWYEDDLTGDTFKVYRLQNTGYTIDNVLFLSDLVDRIENAFQKIPIDLDDRLIITKILKKFILIVDFSKIQCFKNILQKFLDHIDRQRTFDSKNVFAVYLKNSLLH